MDPNAVLAAIRSCIDAYRDPNTTDRARVLYTERIIDCVRELDEGLTKGEPPPDEWRAGFKSALVREAYSGGPGDAWAGAVSSHQLQVQSPPLDWRYDKDTDRWVPAPDPTTAPPASAWPQG